MIDYIKQKMNFESLFYGFVHEKIEAIIKESVKSGKYFMISIQPQYFFDSFPMVNLFEMGSDGEKPKFLQTLTITPEVVAEAEKQRVVRFGLALIGKEMKELVEIANSAPNQLIREEFKKIEENTGQQPAFVIVAIDTSIIKNITASFCTKDGGIIQTVVLETFIKSLAS